APETANQKRKRGRGANASLDNETASQTQSRSTNQERTVQTAGTAEAAEPEEDARPRKRGRPAKIAQQEPELEVAPTTSEPVAHAAPTAKRKRGRPSLQSRGNNTENPEEATPQTNGQSGSRTGGRKASSQQSGLDTATNEPETEAVQTQPKRRGRPPKATNLPAEPEVEADEADDENEGNSSLLRRSGRERRKPGNKARQDPTGTPTNEEEPEVEEAEPSRDLEWGGRERRSPRGANKKSQIVVEEQNEVTEGPPQRRKGRPKGLPVLEDVPDGSPDHASTPRPRPRKRGRPSLQSRQELVLETAEVPEKKTEPTAKPRRRRRRSKEQAEEEEEAEDDPNSPDAEVAAQPKRQSEKPRGDVSAPKKRKSKHAAAAAAQAEERPLSPDPVDAPFRRLTTRTRRVPRDIIDKKWTPLEATSVSSINELLSAVSRPVLLRLNNQQRHAQATAALDIVRKKLRSKLSRGMPFPPPSTGGKREDELQFERTVDGIQSLEAQLDPLLHSVALLKQEKERAQRELDRDYKTLNFLSANARSENRERRDRLRKMHVLVPEPPRDEKEKMAKAAAVGDLVPPRGPGAEQGGKVFVALEEDDELRGLAHQIGNHMESMRSNLQQVEGVAPAIAQSRAALKTVLMPNLDQAAYEKVLFG
ncbi:uncharacterized protein PG998_009340, partial [Apiospora kogelbergensis]|uniref:uncharacterized protein n=1 Tax=Apiospora kogelbergensis TaxID=1337665 RepID=UPI00312F75EB